MNGIEWSDFRSLKLTTADFSPALFASWGRDWSHKQGILQASQTARPLSLGRFEHLSWNWYPVQKSPTWEAHRTELLESCNTGHFQQATVGDGVLVGVGFSAPAIHIDRGNKLDVVVVPQPSSGGWWEFSRHVNVHKSALECFPLCQMNPDDNHPVMESHHAFGSQWRPKGRKIWSEHQSAPQLPFKMYYF